jgi:osmotically-inducible protein OsmY
MANRNDDRDYDRGSQNYGRRSESDYGRSDFGRSYGGSERMFGYSGQTEADRYTRELGSDRSRFYGDTSRDYDQDRERGGERGREGYWGRGWENERDDRSRYGSPLGGGGSERGYNDSSSSGYSQRSNYPSGYRSGERHGQSNYGQSNYGQGQSSYGQGQGSYGQGSYGQGSYGQSNYGQSGYGQSGFDYDRDRYGRGGEGRGGEDRGWWDRASDAVASWFGDEEAERRRRMDQWRDERRGRGPKGYRRSDERIREDVNDRLSDDYYLDASEVEVKVENTEVTLTGTVPSRHEKRRAEEIAENVSGVSNVENRLRVKRAGESDYSSTTTGTRSDTGDASGTSTSAGSTMGSTGTPGTTTSSAAAGGGTTGTRGRSSSGD